MPTQLTPAWALQSLNRGPSDATATRFGCVSTKNFGGQLLMTDDPFGKGLTVGGAVIRPEFIVANGVAGLHGNPRRVNR